MFLSITMEDGVQLGLVVVEDDVLEVVDAEAVM